MFYLGTKCQKVTLKGFHVILYKYTIEHNLKATILESNSNEVDGYKNLLYSLYSILPILTEESYKKNSNINLNIHKIHQLELQLQCALHSFYAALPLVLSSNICYCCVYCTVTLKSGWSHNRSIRYMNCVFIMLLLLNLTVIKPTRH